MNEKIFESSANSIDAAGTATMAGVMIKSMIGIIIAFYVAVPRLASDKFFGEMFFSSGNFFLDIVGMIFFTVVIGAIWFALTKALMTSKGVVLDAITYGITAILAGLFLANSLIVAVDWIGYYGELDTQKVRAALNLTSMITFIAVIGGILILPQIKVSAKVARVGENAAKVLLALALGSFIFLIVGSIFALFGMTFLINIWGQIFYGIGPISILLSVVGVFLAEIMFLATLAFVKRGVDTLPKHTEYFLAIVLVNGILRLYVEIFKLVLKVLAARERN